MRRVVGACIVVAAVTIGVVANRPFFADVAYQRGQTEINIGRPAESLPFLRRALWIDSHSAKAARRIVWAEREMGGPYLRVAIADARAYQEKFPADAGIERELARSLFVSGDYRAAAPVFASLVRGPSSVVNDALYAMIAYENVRDRSDALDVGRAGLRQHPESATLREAVTKL